MSRHREPPLVDPQTDPRRAVGLTTAAAFLGVHAETLRRRIEAGYLRAYRDGKVYKIRVAALEHYRRHPPDTSL